MVRVRQPNSNVRGEVLANEQWCRMNATSYADIIWAAVAGADYAWQLKPRARDRLLAIAPNAASALEHDDAEVNRSLRDILSPILRGIEQRREACDWVIFGWGGIRGNADATLESYANGLGNGTLAAANTFARARRVDGISSWSKVLAFAHPSHHAVYDSRTAVTLNLLLRNAGSKHRFWMPLTQNRQVAAAARVLRAEGNTGDWLGYKEYLAMLKAMVKAGAPSILQAEMALFASAPLLAAEI